MRFTLMLVYDVDAFVYLNIHAHTHTHSEWMLIDASTVPPWNHGGYKQWCRHEINRLNLSVGNGRLFFYHYTPSSLVLLHHSFYVNGNLKLKWKYFNYWCHLKTLYVLVARDYVIQVYIVDDLYCILSSLGYTTFSVAEPTQWANMHRSSTMTLFVLNGTELLLVSLITSVFTLLFVAKMATLKKILNVCNDLSF